VFEQSLLLTQHGHKPWNFLASLTAELVVVSLALLIPLAYRDHLPAFHWKDIAVGPPPAPRPMDPAPAHTSNAANQELSVARRPVFRLDLAPITNSTQPPATEFSSEAPPSVGFGAIGSTLSGPYIPTNSVLVTPPPKPVPEAPKQSSTPIVVGGGVQMAKLVHKVIPVYPSLARMAGISGVVHLIGIIAKDGTIRNLQIVSGHPMLSKAAVEAVEQWVYKPTLLNGNPVEVIAPIDVTFTLGH
jgi:protein TonB